MRSAHLAVFGCILAKVIANPIMPNVHAATVLSLDAGTYHVSLPAPFSFALHPALNHAFFSNLKNGCHHLSQFIHTSAVVLIRLCTSTCGEHAAHNRNIICMPPPTNPCKTFFPFLPMIHITQLPNLSLGWLRQEQTGNVEQLAL